jgi:phage terminase large subunit
MIEFLPKQKEALVYLHNTSPATMILYGGAAGGGKTRLGCIWQIQRRLKYPGTRSLIGRAKLDTLKKTTMASFFETTKQMGLQAGIHYTYNQQSNTITFFNGSIIVLADLAYKPSDPHYQDLGGLELTDAFIDEAAEVHPAAITTTTSRIRYKLTHFCKECAAENLDQGEISARDEKGKAIEWRCGACGDCNGGLVPKTLMSCNPAKGYLYNEFYHPHREGMLTPDKAFIQAFSTDNYMLPSAYIDVLNRLPEVDRKRLLDGDWDFDTSDDRFYSYEELARAFREKSDQSNQWYITADIARLGKDRTIICIWHGAHLERMESFLHKRVNEVADIIKGFMQQYNIPLRNVLADEDGIGGGVCDITRCLGFMNGSRPMRDGYRNLKADCYYKLGEMIDQNQITFNAKYKDIIIKELELVRRDKVGQDGKLMIISKQAIAAKTGGLSPDVADAIMMRSYFEISGGNGIYHIRGRY